MNHVLCELKAVINKRPKSLQVEQKLSVQGIKNENKSNYTPSE